MEIEVKDPSTGALLHLHAKPEHFEGMHGFRISHPNGSGFFIANKGGVWRSADDHHVDNDFLANIGLALEGYEPSDQVVSSKGNS